MSSNVGVIMRSVRNGERTPRWWPSGHGEKEHLGKGAATRRDQFFATIVATLLLGISVACSRAGSFGAQREYVRAVHAPMPNEIVATGTVRPQVGAEVNVGPRISGVLRALHVRVGEQVRPGQLLAVLDHTGLDVAVRGAEFALAEAEAQRALAESQLSRRESLAAEGLLSADELDIARAAAVLAQARSDALHAQLEAARIARGYAEIVAPIAGTVTSIATREGETVAASFAVPTFLTIMDFSRLQVEAYVDEVDIGRIEAGLVGRFSVDTFPDESFEAAVQTVIPQAMVRDNLVTYTVILAIRAGSRELLRPDMTASVTFSTGAPSTGVVLPARAVQRDVSGQAFVTILAAGAEQRREVSLGEVSGDLVRIRAGLAEGEEVLVPSRQGVPK